MKKLFREELQKVCEAVYDLCLADNEELIRKIEERTGLFPETIRVALKEGAGRLEVPETKGEAKS